MYDDKNLYFALRAWDPEPEKINRFVGNRDDNSIGDLISVAFDTYHDYRLHLNSILMPVAIKPTLLLPTPSR